MHTKQNGTHPIPGIHIWVHLLHHVGHHVSIALGSYLMESSPAQLESRGCGISLSVTLIPSPDSTVPYT